MSNNYMENRSQGANTPAAQTLETLHESREMVLMPETSLALENTAIMIDRSKGKLYVRCTFRSITDQEIKAVRIELSCQDAQDGLLGEPVAFHYMDLKTKRGTKFGQTSLIELPDRATRKFQVSVKKVLLADGTAINGGDQAFGMPAPVLLSKHLGSEELAAEYARETTAQAQYVPERGNYYWFCTCGAINENAEENCHNCGCAKEQLIAALNPVTLQANMRSFAEEQARRGQEQAWGGQAQNAQEIKSAEKQAKPKKRRKKAIVAIIISLILVAALGCGAVFFGIPYFNYRAACDALDNGEYDTAYEAFVDLDGFMDSEEMANKALYEKAEAALKNKQYDSAIQIFQSLGDYEDSEEMVKVALYEKGEAALENKQYDSAIQIFESLGDYEDSEDQVLEAKYLLADQYQNDGQYEEAYTLFVELGSYKKSQDEVLATILLWEAEALGSSTTTAASTFSKTVELSSSHYEVFYSTILLYLNGHENAEYWFDWGGTTASKNVQTMLKMLPSSYQDTSTLLKLFNLLIQNSTGYDTLFRENETLMRQCWSLGFVQDLAEQDAAVCYFLESYWSTNNGYNHFNFYENSNGGTTCEYNLPWVPEPYGTKYFDIEDMIFYWDDDNGHLAKVYRFEIVDYDTIRVYCYQDNQTYTLYR